MCSARPLLPDAVQDTPAKSDNHAGVLDMDCRLDAEPDCCGMLIDNDPGSAGILLFEKDRATPKAAREFFESKEGLFPSAAKVEIITVYQASIRAAL